jgi:transposase
MDRAARRTAKAQLVEEMLHGSSWQEAARGAGLQTSRTTAYRLLHRVRTEGPGALDDQRHGHPAKLRAPVQHWLAQFCRAAPASTGRTVQTALFKQFGLSVSISQVNRLRSALGVRRRAGGVGKKSAP